MNPALAELSVPRPDRRLHLLGYARARGPAARLRGHVLGSAAHPRAPMPTASMDRVTVTACRSHAMVAGLFQLMAR